ncbi:pentapeptide repeat-containing protein [Streptomyces iakyrus]|uniref:pentapeptide repeat-containing protein n=1 Tax=Streptomyces iakyrus TaxID=68219 RepID=UPI003D8B2222
MVPGADIDHRGTHFTEALLNTLLNAIRDSATGECIFGSARFEDAHFDDALFEDVKFRGRASFDRATFHGKAEFGRALFSESARFYGVTYKGDADFTRTSFMGKVIFSEANFHGSANFAAATFIRDMIFGAVACKGSAEFSAATFGDTADFDRSSFDCYAGFAKATFVHAALFDQVTFNGVAHFNAASFNGAASFRRVVFSAITQFDGATFKGGVDFVGTRFDVVMKFGPLACGEHVDLSEAIFSAPVTLEIAARTISFVRSRWESMVTLRLRYASVDLAQAVLSFPMAVTSHPALFTFRNDHGEEEPQDESLLSGPPIPVRVTSVQGVDAAHLMMADTDLSECVFFGAFHIDQVRLEGRTIFGQPPVGIHSSPVWWTRRRTLAEEHHWRALVAGQPPQPVGQQPSPRSWRNGPCHPDPTRSPDPEDVAALYRQIRKAFEDSKNEPGAADFYYGEMEMRRHDRTGTSVGERGLLWVYWLMSGYGLRASRALGWLALALIATVILMMGWGLPDSSPKQTATGTIPAAGGRVSLVVDKPESVLTMPLDQRFTTERFDKAVQVVLNSVVFRSSGQDLTTAGTYTEMISRFAEPVLLGLAVLAMRARIKR